MQTIRLESIVEEAKDKIEALTFFSNPPQSVPNKTYHFTQFMVDRVGRDEKCAPPTLQQFMNNEFGYDVAFCRAWSCFDYFKNTPLDKQKNRAEYLLKVIDVIQGASISHLPKVKKFMTHVGIGDMAVHGKAGAGIKENFLSMAKDWNVNADGLIELVRLILSGERGDLHKLTISNEYQLKCAGLYIKTGKDGFVLQTQNENEILKIVEMEYEKDSSFMLWNIQSEAVREKLAIKYINNYFNDMELAKATEEKIKLMGKLARNLGQLHLYFDCNARTMYVLVNLLLYQNGLELCYPAHLSVFEVNSLQKIYTEIQQGQINFKEMFYSGEKLSTLMANYLATIEKLVLLVRKIVQPSSWLDKNTIIHAANIRDLNLLLRQAANFSGYVEIVQLLLEHAELWNVDIFARGVKSGSALDVAKKADNKEAIALLEPYFDKVANEKRLTI